MSRAIVLFLVVVAVAYTMALPQEHAASQECGPNEEFNACGSPCVSTCEKRASPICTLRCEIGCQCKPGFVRNRENKCVLTRDC
ncbi:chymotrypsin inhibitor-like [Colletes gigas]|uniref:chymotrypsin inhibitor-like n=1 Tax=Colletes gigas TaxID=935657 RepID=UPI001C9AADDD|nr:chymotrypsin inhibitor-like [Colletes gigas]